MRFKSSSGDLLTHLNKPWLTWSHKPERKRFSGIFLQALALSDIALTKLNVARESMDDTAGAAQVILMSFRSSQFWFYFHDVPSYFILTLQAFIQLVASEKLRDTGVIASARAAEVYGLNILAERIQVNSSFFHPLQFICWHILLPFLLILTVSLQLVY